MNAGNFFDGQIQNQDGTYADETAGVDKQVRTYRKVKGRAAGRDRKKP